MAESGHQCLRATIADQRTGSMLSQRARQAKAADARLSRAALQLRWAPAGKPA